MPHPRANARAAFQDRDAIVGDRRRNEREEPEPDIEQESQNSSRQMVIRDKCIVTLSHLPPSARSILTAAKLTADARAQQNFAGRG
jgi:hypothetical protein